MDNSNKVILDLCGGTGSWSRPYREAGYDVQLASIEVYTLPPDKVKAKYGACGEYATDRDFVHPEIETATRMRILRGEIDSVRQIHRL